MTQDNPPVAPTRRQLLRVAGSTSLSLLAGASAPVAPAAHDTDANAAAVNASLAALLHGSGLDARTFGAKFDGVADDSAALQRGIDAAHQQRRPLLLPGGTARIDQPLNLIGRDVSIVGAGMTATVLRAGRPLPAIIDVEEAGDRIISPFALMRLTLDGAGTTDRNLKVRFRHHTFLFEVNSIAARTGFWEKDCWLSRRSGCRSGDNLVGWHLVGSNHSSTWESCTITACAELHLKIGNEGSAPDGNAALLFRGCDIEFGKGHGVEIAAATNAVFDSCYLGENIGGDVIRNRGFATIRGGVFFFGGGAGVGVRPLAGRILLQQVNVNAQAGGIATLVNLSAAEATAAEGHGEATIIDANANLPVGGVPVLQGAPLSHVPMTTFAPRLGRDWRAWSHAATLSDERNPAGLPDGRIATCARAGSPAARIGLRATLTQARWRETSPVYLACVYRASAPVDLMLRSAADGAIRPIATLPASPSRSTFINVTTFLPAGPFDTIDASMAAIPGATLGLQELTLADGTDVRTPSGNLKTLALAQ